MSRQVKYEYFPEYGQMFQDLCSKGWTVTAACGQLGIPPSTVYYWARVHEEFKEALGLAKSMRMAFLEEKFMNAKDGVTTTKMIFALKTAGDDNVGEWKERTQMEVTGKDGKDLIPEDAAQDPRRLARAILLVLREGVSEEQSGVTGEQPGDAAKVINHETGE